MMLKSILQDNKPFFIPQLLLFILGSYPLLGYNKVNLFLQVNSYHHPILDQFFYYISFLGGTIAYALLIAILVAVKQDNRTLLIAIGSFVLMSIIIQGLKRVALFDQLRPMALIPTEGSLHLVKGITHKTYWSFPSGHAGTIFTAACLIYLLAPTKSWWLSIFLCFLACAVAYSRVYLCQHFYRDVYIGALIGTCSAIVVYAFLQHWQGPSWLDQTPSALLPIKWKQKIEQLLPF